MADRQNRVIRIECVNEGDFWVVHITRECQDQNRSETVTEKAANMCAALDRARIMVNVPY